MTLSAFSLKVKLSIFCGNIVRDYQPQGNGFWVEFYDSYPTMVPYEVLADFDLFLTYGKMYTLLNGLDYYHPQALGNLDTRKDLKQWLGTVESTWNQRNPQQKSLEASLYDRGLDLLLSFDIALGDEEDHIGLPIGFRPASSSYLMEVYHQATSKGLFSYNPIYTPPAEYVMRLCSSEVIPDDISYDQALEVCLGSASKYLTPFEYTTVIVKGVRYAS